MANLQMLEKSVSSERNHSGVQLLLKKYFSKIPVHFHIISFQSWFTIWLLFVFSSYSDVFQLLTSIFFLSSEFPTSPPLTSSNNNMRSPQLSEANHRLTMDSINSTQAPLIPSASMFQQQKVVYQSNTGGYNNRNAVPLFSSTTGGGIPPHMVQQKLHSSYTGGNNPVAFNSQSTYYQDNVNNNSTYCNNNSSNGLKSTSLPIAGEFVSSSTNSSLSSSSTSNFSRRSVSNNLTNQQYIPVSNNSAGYSSYHPPPPSSAHQLRTQSLTSIKSFNPNNKGSSNSNSTPLRPMSSSYNPYNNNSLPPSRSHTLSANLTGGSISRSTTSATLSKRKSAPIDISLLSKISKEFEQLITIHDSLTVQPKTNSSSSGPMTFRNCFTGQEAVSTLCTILRCPNDRTLALLMGRCLDAQKFIVHCNSQYRLRDSRSEIYTLGSIVSNNIKRPNGVFTLVTKCYSPTCTLDNLCYSIVCPRRNKQRERLAKLKANIIGSIGPSSATASSIKRMESSTLLTGGGKMLWSFSVPKEVLDTVDEREKKRQEVIFETIYTERDYIKDLEYLRDFWIIPLRTRNIIPLADREDFLRNVFGGILDILAVNSELAEELSNRQLKQPVVEEIGDVFIKFIPRFHPYIKYGVTRIFGKYEFERLKKSNTEFANFVHDTEQLKESRKLDLSSFLSKPTSRPARYPLFLNQILKKTKDDSPDKKNIKKAIEMLDILLSKIDEETGYATDKYQIALLRQKLVFKPGEFVDLKLNGHKRRMLYTGQLTRRNNDVIHVYLLDNILLFVKIKLINKKEQHKVFQRPIPIQFLYVALKEEPMTLKEIVAKESNMIGINRSKTIRSSATKILSSNRPSSASSFTNSNGYFNSSPLKLARSSTNMAQGALDAIASSSNTNIGTSTENDTSDSTAVSNNNSSGIAGSNGYSNPTRTSSSPLFQIGVAPLTHATTGGANSSTPGNTTLTTVLTSPAAVTATATGGALATVNSSTSLAARSNTLKLDLNNSSNLKYPMSFSYLGRRGYDLTLYATNYQVQRTLYDAIEQHQEKLKKQNDIFTLVPLTDKFFTTQSERINCAIPFYDGKRLVCGTDSGIYVSTIRVCSPNDQQSRVISNPIMVINKLNVTQVEVLDDYQTLLAICDKKLYSWPLDALDSFNVKENTKKGKELLNHVSFFKVGAVEGMKLICAAKNGSSHSIKIFEPIDFKKKFSKKKFLNDSKELPFNSEIVSISFLKLKLCVVGCTRGFQVVSIKLGNMEPLLHAADTSLDFVTKRESLKPISIFKLNSDYLLSYSDFSFFISTNGWRIRPSWIIHWEGIPQSFALWYPFLLSFDNNFIEIRDCNTSELLRVITGEGIRLLHSSSQEILYAYIDENGFDVIASLDFWDKANKRMIEQQHQQQH